LQGCVIFVEKSKPNMNSAAIDFGNTFAKIGFFQENELLEIHKGLTINKLHKIILKKKPSKIIISSVTKSQEELTEIFKDFPNKLILSPNTILPIKKDYETPETLGADRLAAAVGANFLFPNENCLIIDMGTAIKYDYVSADATFRGGIISLGKRIRFEALHSFTKRLPLVEEEGLPNLIGRSTKTCIQSGVINGIIAEVNGIIEKYEEFGKNRIILCGGDAPFFENQIKKPTFAVPNLVLMGLNRILNYHAEQK
jgi:type III pantothenate kinase